jgi:hypothetical protein
VLMCLPRVPGQPGPRPRPRPRAARRPGAAATRALAHKAAANRQVIAIMGGRLERGEPVVPMYGPLGLAWLQRQAEIAEQLIQQREGR